jgi:diguanylate cyclase (GGDEF)-like protein
MINILILTIIVLYFVIIVYYFREKEYREHSELNTLFFISAGLLFFVPIILSFLKVSNTYLLYIYILVATSALIINYTLTKYLLNKENNLRIAIYLIYLFINLIFLQFDKNLNYIKINSQILTVLYFLDIGYYVNNSSKIREIHKIFFSTLFILWASYEFLTIFFTTNILYLVGLIFPISVSYEFINLQLELINNELKSYGKRFKSIFDNASDAFFVIDRKSFEVLNINNSVTDIFDINNKNVDQIDLEDIFEDDSYNELMELIKDNKGLENNRINELKARDQKNNIIHLESEITSVDFENENAIILAMKDKTQEIKLKNKIEELHDVAIKMENSSKKEEIYSLTVEAADSILDYDVVSLDIVKDDKLIPVGISKDITDKDVKSVDLDEASLATKTYHEQRTIVCNNIPAERDASPVKFQYKSALTVPISKFGIFQIISEEFNYFTNQDKNLVELLISHTSAALKRLNREEEIRYFGFHDYLTELYNRDYIEEELFRLNQGRQYPLSLIVADVNGLKLINDTFGHADGDKLLKMIANTLKESCRDEDILGRWGGDEFLIVLPETDKNEAEKIILRMEQRLSAQHYKEIPLSVSFGYATKNKNDNIGVKKLIDEADHKMYNNKTQDYKKNSEKMLEVLYNKLNSKGFETSEHCKRVERIAGRFAEVLNLKQEYIDNVKKVARIHDIGMVNIPFDIVNKKGELTSEEYTIVKSHPEVGFRIANSLNENSEIGQSILHHHEWWNGTGYPKQIIGKNIPLISRIITLVDAFDVMTHNQVYKDKVSKDKALKRIKAMAGIQFDPDLSDTFINDVIK